MEPKTPGVQWQNTVLLTGVTTPSAPMQPPDRPTPPTQSTVATPPAPVQVWFNLSRTAYNNFCSWRGHDKPMHSHIRDYLQMDFDAPVPPEALPP